jgi:addiction module HigA family antidote
MPKNATRPIHPGEMLRQEFLAPLGMSAHALAQALRVPATWINDVVNKRRAITADTALRLARGFRTAPEVWMNVQAVFELRSAEGASKDSIERDVLPREARYGVRRGWTLEAFGWTE